MLNFHPPEASQLLHADSLVIHPMFLPGSVRQKIREHSQHKAVKNRSNEELIRYLNNEGFEDVEFCKLEGWIGFEQSDIPPRFIQ